MTRFQFNLTLADQATTCNRILQVKQLRIVCDERNKKELRDDRCVTRICAIYARTRILWSRYSWRKWDAIHSDLYNFWFAYPLDPFALFYAVGVGTILHSN